MEPTHDPALAELLSFFDFAHLRERTPHLAAASEPFHRLAHIMAPDPSAAVDGLRATILRMDCEPGREAAAAALKLRRLEAALVAPDYAVIDSAGPEDFLRTLLEAKDCAVRAALVRHREQRAAEPVSDAGLPMAAAHEVEIREGLHRASVPVTPQTIAAFLEGQASRPAPAPIQLASDVRLAAWPEHPIATNGYRVDVDGPITVDPSKPSPFVGSPLSYPATFHAWRTGEDGKPWSYEFRVGADVLEAGTADDVRGALGWLPYALGVAGLSSCMVTLGPPERWPGEHAGKGESGQPGGRGGRGGQTTREQAIADMLAMGMTRERAESILGAAGLQSNAYPEPDAAGNLTLAAEPGVTMPDDEPHAEPPKAFTAPFCRWWHEQTGEHYGPGLHESAPVEMSGASRVFEAGRRSALKRERLADFVVGIDVEQGPGLAVLRGLVTELGAVADRVEAALPAEPSAVLGAGEGAQIGTTKHWLAVHEIGPDGEVDERVRIPEAWRDQARALLGQGSILVLVEATAFDPSKMRVIGE